MKRLGIFLFVLSVVFSLSGCSKSASVKSEADTSSISNESSGLNSDLISWNDGISLPIPKPNAASFTIDDWGTVYCYGMQPEDFENYKQVLISDGFTMLSDNGGNPSGNYDSSFVFIKNNREVFILDQTFGTSDVPEEKQIRITIKQGLSNEQNREGALTKEKAKELIQNYNNVAAEEDLVYNKTVCYLVELDVKDAYGKMGLQAYTGYSNTGSIGEYLICHESVRHVFQLGETCVADIDKDGEYEFLNLVGWGSGIYRYTINAFKFGNPAAFNSLTKVLYSAYSNCWVPDAGFAELTIQKVNETQIKLYGGHLVKGEVAPDVDYGLLKIDGNQLVPSLNDFPFKELNE